MIAASSTPAIPAYSVTARVLHWLIAALVLPMIALGIIIANEWGGPVQQPLYDLHKSIGALLLPLIIVRLVYRLAHPPLPLPPTSRPSSNSPRVPRTGRSTGCCSCSRWWA